MSHEFYAAMTGAIGFRPLSRSWGGSRRVRFLHQNVTPIASQPYHDPVITSRWTTIERHDVFALRVPVASYHAGSIALWHGLTAYVSLGHGDGLGTVKGDYTDNSSGGPETSTRGQQPSESRKSGSSADATC